jgi:DNA-binding NarL/FixJ family response regulator
MNENTSEDLLLKSDSMASEREFTVLIVDDQTLLVDLLCEHIDRQPGLTVCGRASSGAEGLVRLSELKPDVMLLDIRLGDIDGFEVLKTAKATSPGTRIVLFTGYYQEEAIYRAFRLGASGYISKEAGLDAVTDAIRTAHHDHALLDPKATTRLLRRGRRHKALPELEPLGDPALAALTAREFEILQMIADGLSNLQIAQKLVISEYTVKTHISNLFRKIGVNDRVQAIIFALDRGLR